MRSMKVARRSGKRAWLKAAGAIAAATAIPAWGQMKPDETVRAMQVADGLAVSVFASEPMFGNPCDMEVDSKGRVWVTEGWNYRASKLRPEGDRIVVMEDTDGDGVADKATTFYQGTEINSALGICVLGDKVIVSCCPNVYLFEDKDGDLKADGPPKKFLTGFGGVRPRPRRPRHQHRPGRQAVLHRRQRGEAAQGRGRQADRRRVRERGGEQQQAVPPGDGVPVQPRRQRARDAGASNSGTTTRWRSTRSGRSGSRTTTTTATAGCGSTT